MTNAELFAEHLWSDYAIPLKRGVQTRQARTVGNVLAFYDVMDLVRDLRRGGLAATIEEHAHG